jgi:hypothetical protein
MNDMKTEELEHLNRIYKDFGDLACSYKTLANAIEAACPDLGSAEDYVLAERLESRGDQLEQFLNRSDRNALDGNFGREAVEFATQAMQDRKLINAYRSRISQEYFTRARFNNESLDSLRAPRIQGLFFYNYF